MMCNPGRCPTNGNIFHPREKPIFFGFNFSQNWYWMRFYHHAFLTLLNRRGEIADENFAVFLFQNHPPQGKRWTFTMRNFKIILIFWATQVFFKISLSQTRESNPQSWIIWAPMKSFNYWATRTQMAEQKLRCVLVRWCDILIISVSINPWDDNLLVILYNVFFTTFFLRHFLRRLKTASIAVLCMPLVNNYFKSYLLFLRLRLFSSVCVFLRSTYTYGVLRTHKLVHWRVLSTRT